MAFSSSVRSLICLAPLRRSVKACASSAPHGKPWRIPCPVDLGLRYTPSSESPVRSLACLSKQGNRRSFALRGFAVCGDLRRMLNILPFRPFLVSAEAGDAGLLVGAVSVLKDGFVLLPVVPSENPSPASWPDEDPPHFDRRGHAYAALLESDHLPSERSS